MEFIRSLLCKNLLDLRKGHALTQKQVADAIGVSQPTYGRWENGIQWIEDPASLEKLAGLYGVRTSRLFYDPDLEKPADALPRLSNKEIIKDLQAIIDKLQ